MAKTIAYRMASTSNNMFKEYAAFLSRSSAPAENKIILQLKKLRLYSISINLLITIGLGLYAVMMEGKDYSLTMFLVFLAATIIGIIGWRWLIARVERQMNANKNKR